MTKLEIDAAIVLIANLFPASAKWTEERVECLREGMARIGIDGAQASACIREHRRTAKYNSPTEADLLAAMRRASGETGQAKRMDAPKEEGRLSVLRRLLGMPDGSPGTVMDAWAVDAAGRSDRLRRHRPGWLWRSLVEEYGEVLGMPEGEALERIEYLIGEAPDGWRECHRERREVAA